MGTSGFVGQIMAIETMGMSVEVIVLILVFHIVLPAVVTYLIYVLMRQLEMIKDGDQILHH